MKDRIEGMINILDKIIIPDEDKNSDSVEEIRTLIMEECDKLNKEEINEQHSETKSQ